MPRPRKASKSEGQSDTKPVKITITLAPELARRLGVQAAMLGQTRSEIVAELVRGLKRFRVHDHEKVGDATEPGQGTDAA